MKTVTEALLKFGFDENEITIYLTALRHGPLAMAQIIEALDIPKLTAVSAVEALLDRGLLFVYPSEPKKFGSERPARIVQHLESLLSNFSANLDFIKDSVGELEATISDGRPQIRYYEGKEGIAGLIGDRHLEQPNEVLVFYPPDGVQGFFSGDEIIQMREQRVRRNIFHRVIKSGSVQVGNEPLNLAEGVCVPQHNFPFSCDVEIWNDKVMIAKLDQGATALVIQSQQVADTFRSIFQLAYEGAEKYDKELNAKEDE